MTSTENIKRFIQDLKKYSSWRILIDTCSILENDFVLFSTALQSDILTLQYPIYVPIECIRELEKHKNSNKDIANTAQQRLEALAKLQAKKLIEIRGDPRVGSTTKHQTYLNFADKTFLYVFEMWRGISDLLLITQDKDLATDILKKNDNVSVKTKHKIHVKKFQNARMVNMFEAKNTKEKPHNRKNDNKDPLPHQVKNSTQTREDGKKLKKEPLFTKQTKLSDKKDIEISISHLPTENDFVFIGEKKNQAKLISTIASGGEGTLYSLDCNPNIVAKIYKREKITLHKKEKIEKIVEKNPNYKGICFPSQLVYNQNGEFVGYTMPKAQGDELGRSVFFKQLLQKKFPNWKKQDTVQLCITILDKIHFLNKNNIIMGDINPANILVVSPTEVFFVDTDSYQIEDYPCPVGTINFTAPEIQKKHYAEFLRTQGNENFAIATLLFMIMLPGKPPYSQQGGESQIDNILKMDFSYPLGEKSNKKTPDGAWRFIWSHLTYELKEAFYNTFSKDGQYSDENKRLDAKKWLQIFKKYHYALSHDLLEKDEMANELFPTRYKKNPSSTYIRCKLCNQEADTERCKEGICPNCLQPTSGEVLTCASCNEKFLFSNFEKYVKQIRQPSLCGDCRDQKRKIREYNNQIQGQYSCIDCGAVFTLTNGDLQRFSTPPKRCQSCRISKRQQNQKSSKSWCFITTSVCSFYEKQDNCEELTLLRNYRDTWLCNQKDGKNLIQEYYKIAPRIVQQIETSPHYAFYCRFLYHSFILPCISLIKKNKMDECKTKYVKMINFLIKHFKIGEKYEVE